MLEQFTREQFTTRTQFTSGATYYHKVHTHNRTKRGYGILSLSYNGTPIIMRVITRNAVIRVEPYYNVASDAITMLTLLNTTILSTRLYTPTIRDISKIYAGIVDALARNAKLEQNAYRAYSVFCSDCNARYAIQRCYCDSCIACYKFARYVDYDASVDVDYHIEQHRARYAYCDVCGYCNEHCYGYHTMEDYNDYE